MIENKADYMTAISTTLDVDNKTAELIYKLVCNDRVAHKDIRDKAIAYKFDRYIATGVTHDWCYCELSTEFNISWSTCQKAVSNRRNNKFKKPTVDTKK